MKKGNKNIQKVTSSANEVKNSCCLIERLFKVKKNSVFLFGISFLVFKVKKNSVFLFGISFLVLEIFTFLYQN